MAATYSDVVIEHVDLYGSIHMHCVVHRPTQIEFAACSVALPSVAMATDSNTTQLCPLTTTVSSIQLASAVFCVNVRRLTAPYVHVCVSMCGAIVPYAV